PRARHNGGRRGGLRAPSSNGFHAIAGAAAADAGKTKEEIEEVSRENGSRQGSHRELLAPAFVRLSRLTPIGKGYAAAAAWESRTPTGCVVSAWLGRWHRHPRT